jgi:hypothetical protein
MAPRYRGPPLSMGKLASLSDTPFACLARKVRVELKCERETAHYFGARGSDGRNASRDGCSPR